MIAVTAVTVATARTNEFGSTCTKSRKYMISFLSGSSLAVFVFVFAP